MCANHYQYISVVIPAYNRAAHIGKAVESVMQQSYTDFEAIIVDDGSTDATVEVVMRYARRDKRIRLVRHERNRGAQAARNTGIRAARGSWIAFLDSDDSWLPESLKLRIEAAENEKVSVVHSVGFITCGDGRLEIYPDWRVAGNAYRELLAHDGPMFQGLLVTKEALERIGYLDERVVSYQEWDTFIRLAKYYPFGFEPRPTFIYECRTPESISKDIMRQAIGYKYIFKKHLPEILRQLGPDAMAHHYRFVAQYYRDANDHHSAKRNILIASMWNLIARVSSKIRRLSFRIKVIVKRYEP
jgi:glycosyltransferase involved in cell wall biosynthesis